MSVTDDVAPVERPATPIVMLGVQASGDREHGCGVCRFGLVVFQRDGQQPDCYACICERGKAKQQIYQRLMSIQDVLTAEEQNEFWPSGIPEASRDRVAAILVEARIPPKFLPWSMASYTERFKGERDPKRYAKLAAEWIALAPADRSDLVVYGPNGTGKTGLAIAIARAIAERYQKPLFYTMRELSIAWRDTYNTQQANGAEDQSEAEFLASLLDPHLLIVDEVSGQRMTEFVEDTLTMIVDARQKLLKPTLLTLNLPAEQPTIALEDAALLTELLGPTLQDRLRERAQYWPLKGQSRRPTYTRKAEAQP